MASAPLRPPPETVLCSLARANILFIDHPSIEQSKQTERERENVHSIENR
jgi:hypothetical protein